MEQFTPEQRQYIDTTIGLAIAQMENQVGSILTESKAMQDKIAGIVEKHSTELRQSSERVTALVETAIKWNKELAGSTAKIHEAESARVRACARAF